MTALSPSPADTAWTSRIHVYALLGAIVLVPVANLPDHLVWFDITPKVAAMLLMVGLACVFMPTRVFDAATGRRSALRLPIAMIAVAVLSTIFSCSPLLSIGGSSWRRVGLPAVVALAVFMMLQTETAQHEARHFLWCLRASSLTLLVSSLMVVVQFEDQGSLLGFELWVDSTRPGGLLGSGAAFGCYATSPLFLCVALWFADRAVHWRYVALLAGILGLAALLLSGTRAGALGVAIGLLISFFLVRRRSAELLIGLSLGLVIVAGLAITNCAPLLNRFQQVQSDLWGGTRLDVWRDSLRLFGTLPPFGYGLESFPRLYPKVESAQTAFYWPNTFHESVHNYLLDTVLSQGILGLVVVTALSLSAYFAFTRLPEQSKLPYSFCLAGHMACFVNCMFFTPQLSTLLCLYLPVCLIWGSSTERYSVFHRVGLPFGRHPWLLRLGACRTVLIRGLGVALAAYSLCLFMWDSRVYETKMLFDSGRTDEAVKAFARARHIAPPGVAAEAWFSRELIGKLDSAAPKDLFLQLHQSLRAAIAQEEEFGNSSVLLGISLINEGRGEEAKPVLRRTIGDIPNWELPKEILAALEAKTR